MRTLSVAKLAFLGTLMFGVPCGAVSTSFAPAGGGPYAPTGGADDILSVFDIFDASVCATETSYNYYWDTRLVLYNKTSGNVHLYQEMSAPGGGGSIGASFNPTGGVFDTTGSLSDDDDLGEITIPTNGVIVVSTVLDRTIEGDEDCIRWIRAVW